MAGGVTLQIPGKLSKALDTMAIVTGRSKNYVVREALKTYMAEYADYKIARDRLHDKKDSILSSKELKDLLGL